MLIRMFVLYLLAEREYCRFDFSDFTENPQRETAALRRVIGNLGSLFHYETKKMKVLGSCYHENIKKSCYLYQTCK